MMDMRGVDRDGALAARSYRENPVGDYAGLDLMCQRALVGDVVGGHWT